jgi:formylglycine-generating enzyme required for sulfatase activity
MTRRCFPRFPPRLLALVVVAVALAAAACTKGTQAPPPTVTTRGGIAMVLVPAGSFTMGSVAGNPDEAPPHRVSVDAFLLDRHEVTQAVYEELSGINPAHFKGAARPVEQISWAAAARFCNARSRAEGLTPCYDEQTAACNFEADGYRLPTEAEWEYACRAGATGEYPFGDDARPLEKHAWFAENAAKTTRPVGEKRPNAWGLYDMLGNVAEWCNDIYDPAAYAACARQEPAVNPRGPAAGETYVLRGGAWNVTAAACRPATRVGEDPGFQDACFAADAIGFRCVRRAPAAGPAAP